MQSSKPRETFDHVNLVYRKGRLSSSDIDITEKTDIDLYDIYNKTLRVTFGLQLSETNRDITGFRSSDIPKNIFISDMIDKIVFPTFSQFRVETFFIRPVTVFKR